MSRCVSCGAVVASRLTLAGGRWLDLDPRPSPDGNLAVVRNDDPEVCGRVVVLGGPSLTQARRSSTPLYRLHACGELGLSEASISVRYAPDRREAG
jgi:hypothetical protein